MTGIAEDIMPRTIECPPSNKLAFQGRGQKNGLLHCETIHSYMSSRRPYRIQGINLFINRMPGIFQNPRSIGFALKLKRHTHGQPTKAVPEFSIDSKTIGEIISSTDMKS